MIETKESKISLLPELEEMAAKERLSGEPLWLPHLEAFLKKAEDAGDASAVQYCYSLLAEASYIKSDMELFRSSLIRAAEMMAEGQNKRAMSIAYNTMGIDAMNNGNLVLALEDFREALEAAEDERQTYVEKANISNIYELIGDYEKALKETTEIADYYEQNPSPKNAMNQMLTIVQSSEFCLKLHDPDGAKEMLDRLERLIPSLPDHVLSEPVIPELRAHHAFYEGDTATAHRYVDDYLDALVTFDLIVDMIYDVVRFGHEMIERGEAGYARRIVELLKDPVRESGVLYFEEIYLGLLIDYNEAMGDPAENPAHYKRYFEITRQREKEDITIVDTHIKFREGLVAMTERQKQMKVENQRLRTLADTDALTGIANRQSWNRQAKAVLLDAAVSKKSLAFEILDIDDFKQVNDHYGHSVGDRYLKEVGNALREIEGEHVFPARLGGDEFCILYVDLPKEEVEKIAEGLSRKICEKNLPNEYAQAAKTLTISQGIYWDIPDGGNSLEEYLSKADAALYCVKENGRNGIRMS